MANPFGCNIFGTFKYNFFIVIVANRYWRILFTMDVVNMHSLFICTFP